MKPRRRAPDKPRPIATAGSRRPPAAAGVRTAIEQGMAARFERIGQSLRTVPTLQFTSELEVYERKFAELALRYKYKSE